MPQFWGFEEVEADFRKDPFKGFNSADLGSEHFLCVKRKQTGGSPGPEVKEADRKKSGVNVSRARSPDRMWKMSIRITIFDLPEGERPHLNCSMTIILCYSAGTFRFVGLIITHNNN